MIGDRYISSISIDIEIDRWRKRRMLPKIRIKKESSIETTIMERIYYNLAMDEERFYARPYPKRIN